MKPGMRTRKKFSTEVDQLFWRVEKEKMLAKQKNRCHYCGCDLIVNDATVDHVIPLRDTGYHHSYKNCVIACWDCNQKKGKLRNFKLISADETPVDKVLRLGLERLEKRIRLAEYRLSFDQKGSFNKWQKFHERRHRWTTKR